MKPHTLTAPAAATSRPSEAIRFITRQTLRILSLARRVILATVPSAALILMTAWATTDPNFVPVLQAAFWSLGFVFLAIALDSGKRAAILLVLTSIALSVLTLSATHHGSEWLIAAAMLIAAWSTTALLKFLDPGRQRSR